MDRPLKWHKFLIYFALWISALSALFRAAALFLVGLGPNLGDGNPFSQIPALKLVSLAYGVIYVAYAVYCIYVRYQLAGFKEDAPKKLLTSFLIYPVIELSYAPVALLFAGLPVAALLKSGKFIGGIIGAVIGTWIVYAIHKIYYNNRKELFVN